MLCADSKAEKKKKQTHMLSGTYATHIYLEILYTCVYIQ